MKPKNIILSGYVFKGLAIVLAAIAIALMLTSCGKAADKAAVAIVIDKGQNSQLADGADSCIEQAVHDVLCNGGYLSIVGASGQPQVICSKTVKEPGNTSKTALENRYKKDADFAEARSINDWTPNAEEVDLLKSVKLAADTLNSSEAKGCATRTMYIIAPGPSSAGLIDLTGRGRYGDLLAWDYDELIRRIAEDTTSGSIEAEGLPSLQGIRVVFMNFGAVAGTQVEIDPVNSAKIKDLWTHVLQSCGAEFDPKTGFQSVATGESVSVDHSKLPKVTPVVFEEALAVSTVSFDESVLAFNPNEDTYRDGQAYVDSVLAPYAESLVQTKAKVVILGTVAKEYGKEDGAYDLGRRRAERVKSDLARLGVDPDQLIVCSAGFDGVGIRVGNEIVDFYHDNYNSDGSFNETVATTNRAIHIIPLSMASDVIAKFSI